MSTSKINEIACEIESLSGGRAHIVEQEVAAKLLHRVAQMHIKDVSTRYWWSSLKARPSESHYGESISFWSDAMEGILSGVSGNDVFVAITDDDDGPWPVVSVDKSCLCRLLKELPFFEYFFFDASCELVVFDTHLNALVASKCHGAAMP